MALPLCVKLWGLAENMVLEADGDDVEGTLAPLKPYTNPVALHIARSYHGVSVRIETGAVGIRNRLSGPVDVEAIGPEVLSVGLLQAHVNVPARRPGQ